MHYLISFLIGYVFGIIPFCYLLGKIKGIDVRKFGSGNIGATNLGRAAGLPFFIIGFVLDGAKGLIPVLLAKSFAYPAAFAAAGAILGHIFNPLFKFSGGKGVSTTIGASIGIVPKSFLISLAIWLIVYLSSFIVALASLSFAIALPITCFLLEENDLIGRIFMLVIALFIVYAHRSNIKRILRKQETKFVIWRKK